MLGKKSDNQEPWLSDDALREIWQGSKFESLLRSIVTEPRVDFIRLNLAKVITVLIIVRWDRWSTFDDIFVRCTDTRHEYSRLDGDLPFRDCSFLGSFDDNFSADQYIVLPIHIIGGQNQYFPDMHWRLPFIHTQEKVRQGGIGQVTKCVVARGHFRKDEEPIEHHSEEIVIGRKRIDIRIHHDDIRNMKLLRGSHLKHDHIMHHISTLIHGDDFNVFSPWTDIDLGIFLHHKQLGITQSRMGGFLLEEASHLADALDFLHTRISIPGRRHVPCVHMDLKPENIVVQPRAQGSSGMMWLITDFEISVVGTMIANEDYPQALGSVRDLAACLTGKARCREPGPFQAPEIRGIKGQKPSFGSDVWSLGCVLSLVLCTAAEGSEGVAQLDKEPCRDNASGFFYRRKQPPPNHNHASAWEMNPFVIPYLEGLVIRHDKRHQTWLRPFVDLIKDTMEIDIHQRPQAAECSKHLRQILDLSKQAMEPHELCGESPEIQTVPYLRSFPQALTMYDPAQLSAKSDPLCFDPQKEVLYPIEIRRNTTSGELNARDTETLAANVASRAESAPELAYRALRTSWIPMPTARQKVKMPSGKFIQASFSPSGMTMVLLSERQVIVHPIGEIFGSPNLKPRDRYQLVRSIDDLSVAHGTGKLRSVSASDDFILFRSAGQVRFSMFNYMRYCLHGLTISHRYCSINCASVFPGKHISAMNGS